MTSIATARALIERTFLGGLLRIITLVVAVVALVAFSAAGWFGLSWYRVAQDKSLVLGRDREAVLQDAQRATLTLNTLDYRQVQEGLTRWEQSAAGSLLTLLRANRDSYARAITDSATISVANVLDAAVASLDERSGTAQVLVGVDVTSQSEQGDPSCTQRRVRLQMVRTADTWKVGTLTPVGDAYSEPGSCPQTSSPK